VIKTERGMDEKIVSQNPLSSLLAKEKVEGVILRLF
jgi:hypothetical protein